MVTKSVGEADADETGSVACRSRNTVVQTGWNVITAVLPTSRPLAAAASLAALLEALAITRGAPNLYDTCGRTIAFGLCYLVWYWVSAAWIAQGIGSYWRELLGREGGWSRGFLWLALAIPVAVGVLAYAVSWALFLSSGRFANLETGRFVVFNFGHLWSYMLDGEPVQLIAAGVVLAVAVTALPAFIYWSVSAEQRRRVISSPARHSCLGWVALTGLTLSLWNLVPSDESVLRRATRLHVLRNAINPTFSLYISKLESELNGHVAPHLDTSRMQRIVPPEPNPPAAELMIQSAPSIILVAIESLRHDTIYQVHQGREVMPNLNRLASNGLHLTRAYAESTHSDYADVCLVSSLYPLRSLRHHYYAPSDPWPKTLIYERLKSLGYATAIISSQNEAWGGMAHFLKSPQLDHFYHPETAQRQTLISDMDPGFFREVRLGGLLAGKFPDAHTTDEAIAWVTEQSQAQRPFFLSMNLQSSHFPYLLPPDVGQPFQPCKLDPSISFVDYPINQVETVRNAYFNAIQECDHQLGRLVATLEALGRLENTILVVTGENGEAFHECGTVAHAREPVEPAIHVACVIYAPQRLAPRVEAYPFEHVDLVPTLAGLLGLPPHPNYQGIDVLAPDRPPAEERLTFCHVITSLAEADAVTLGGRWKLTVDRRSGQATLHDVLHDPGQTQDRSLSDLELTRKLRIALETWRQQQLAFYHFPTYYLSFYPPPPPRWRDLPGQETEIH